MSDLPTREEATNLVRHRDRPENTFCNVMRAFGNGTLQTKAEWRDSLDYEAMKQQVESIASYYADEYTKITDKQVEVFMSRILAAAFDVQP